MRIFSIIIFLSLLASGVASQAQTPATSSYPDSADGFRQQLEALISTFKSGDLAAFRADLDTLAIPNANDWVASRFSPGDLPKLQRDYRESFAVFERHLYWVVENAAPLSPAGMAVMPWQAPLPPSESGPEQGQPSPLQPIGVEYFRYGPFYPRKGIPPSWVNSFVYIDGMFRFVGGNYPFWWEGLERLRPREQTGLQPARVLHKVPPEYPKKARKQSVEGIVRLHAIIGKDGAPRELTVISGHPLLADAALKAVRQWRYEPTLLLGKPVEVDTTIDVVFTLNHH